MSVEVWHNAYSGFDEVYGTTRWVMDAFRGLLPEPIIDPVCKKKGHRWSKPLHPLAKETEVVGCIRCARRGLVVFESRGEL